MWIYIPILQWFDCCLGKTIYVEWWHERLKNTLNSSVREAWSPAGEAAAEPFTSKPFSKTTWSFPNQHMAFCLGPGQSARNLGKGSDYKLSHNFLMQFEDFCWFVALLGDPGRVSSPAKKSVLQCFWMFAKMVTQRTIITTITLILSLYFHLAVLNPDSVLPQTWVGETHTLQSSQGPENLLFAILFFTSCVFFAEIQIVTKLTTITSWLSNYIISDNNVLHSCIIHITQHYNTFSISKV